MRQCPGPRFCTGSAGVRKRLGSCFASSPGARTRGKCQSSHNWPSPAGGRPPQKERRAAGHPPPPTNFLPAVVYVDRQPPFLDGEAGFLAAIQSDMQLMTAGLCTHTRGVPHGPERSRRAQTLCERKCPQMYDFRIPTCSSLEPHDAFYDIEVAYFLKTVFWKTGSLNPKSSECQSCFEK